MFESLLEPGSRRAAPLGPAVLVLALVLLAGCRTYGSYDATEKMLPEMRQSVQLFADDLERARSAQNLLRQAASGDSALAQLAADYRQAVSRHEAMLDENRTLLDRFTDDLPDYRTMHRTFGAMLSEHQTARNRYRSLVKAVRYPGATPPTQNRRVDPGSTSSPTRPRMRDETFTEGRYYVAPIFYERLQSAGNTLTMRQALAERGQRQAQASRLAPGRREDGSQTLPADGSPAPSPSRTAPAETQ